MNKESGIKVWLGQIRAPFLLLPILLVLIGAAAAHQDGVFDWLRFVLAMVGVTLSHVAVNLFNEHSDNRTGIDDHTTATPFSGGSGNLQQGKTTPGAVLAAAVVTLAISLAIGIYLSVVSGWFLMLFIVTGGIATVFYTSHLSRWMIGELAAGITLGTFVVLGAYYAMAGTLTTTVILLSIPPGILTALLLLLNEFPDAEADRQGGRRHLVIVLGHRRAAVLYTLSLAVSYLVLVGGAITGRLPATVLLALLTTPLAIKASITALRHGADAEKLVPGLGANVGVVLGTDLLLAVALFIS